MTSEKETFERDDLVSETYRELGTETVPEHLNQRILRTASDGGKQSPARGILFAAWLKPAAWAATMTPTARLKRRRAYAGSTAIRRSTSWPSN